MRASRNVSDAASRRVEGCRSCCSRWNRCSNRSCELTAMASADEIEEELVDAEVGAEFRVEGGGQKIAFADKVCGGAEGSEVFVVGFECALEGEDADGERFGGGCTPTPSILCKVFIAEMLSSDLSFWILPFDCGGTVRISLYSCFGL